MQPLGEQVQSIGHRGVTGRGDTEHQHGFAFALSRWCAATGSEQIKPLSDYQERDFGLKYGVLIKELKLLAHSVWLIDREAVIRNIELVPEMTHELDYDQALAVLKQVVF